MMLENFADVSPTWGLSFVPDGDPIVGPLKMLQYPPDVTVTLIGLDDIPTGTKINQRHIRENAQEFDVDDYEFEGYRGLFHRRGRNWIIWTEDLKRIYVTPSPENPTLTWVYVRFVLRHFILAHFMSRPGYRRLHAVAGPLVSHESGLMIAGPYLSGKTYLIQCLIESGLVAEQFEDDCAVIDPDWLLRALIPAEKQIQQTQKSAIRIMLCLDRTAEVIESITPLQAAEWAFPIQASWPLSWLPPLMTVETGVEFVPTDLACLRMPEKPHIEDAITAIRRLIDSLS